MPPAHILDSDWSVPGPDLEIRGAPVSKKIFSPFGPQFGLKIRGGGSPGAPGPSPGSATAGRLRHWLKHSDVTANVIWALCL